MARKVKIQKPSDYCFARFPGLQYPIGGRRVGFIGRRNLTSSLTPNNWRDRRLSLVCPFLTFGGSVVGTWRADGLYLPPINTLAATDFPSRFSCLESTSPTFFLMQVPPLQVANPGSSRCQMPDACLKDSSRTPPVARDAGSPKVG